MLRPIVLAALALTLLTAAPALAADPVTTTILLQTGTNNIGQKIVYPRTREPEITTAIVELAVGAATPLHKHPNLVIGYMLQGELEVRAEGGKVNRYKAGDSFVEALNHTHQGVNVGTVPVKILVTYLGAKSVPVTTPAKK